MPLERDTLGPIKTTVSWIIFCDGNGVNNDHDNKGIGLQVNL